MEAGMRRRLEQGLRNAGFSLPELLVVMALIGIFVLFGGPAMADAYKAYKVRSAADELTVDIRALRYNAVTNRASRTMTFRNQNDPSAPNQYSFSNAVGQPVTVQFENGVNIETSSATSLTFNINGSTGAVGNTTIVMSCDINSGRGDRYTITVTPSGTVSSARATYVP
jgi:prepilin-type N-terminal cleavage/methylation domain-containing protein